VIIKRGTETTIIEKITPHLVFVLNPEEVKALLILLENSQAPNLLVNKELITDLQDFIKTLDKTTREKITGEGEISTED